MNMNSLLSFSRLSVGRFGASIPVRASLAEIISQRPAIRGEYPSAGRAWLASELRLKSFDDLHKLWFVLYKEKINLLSEKEHFRAMGQRLPNAQRLSHVRQSMARLQTVLHERRMEKKAQKELQVAGKK